LGITRLCRTVPETELILDYNYYILLENKKFDNICLPKDVSIDSG